MTRLLALFALLVTLNACEQHKAEDLPEKFQEKEKHGAVREAVAGEGSALAAVAR